MSELNKLYIWHYLKDKVTSLLMSDYIPKFNIESNGKTLDEG